MTPEEREAALARQRKLAASVLSVNRTADRARGISALVSAPCFGWFSLLVRWHDWPWLPLPVALALGAALAAREVRRRALERHKRTPA